MPSFEKNPTTRTPFGKNQYLRSTRGLKFESYTLAADTVPEVEIDGFDEKYLQPGTVMARITAVGDNEGKIGPYEPGDDPSDPGNGSGAASDGREDPANIVGVLETFLPWQLKHRDVEVAVAYEAAVVQDRCYELVDGEFAALSDDTRDAMAALPRISMTFH